MIAQVATLNPDGDTDWTDLAILKGVSEIGDAQIKTLPTAPMQIIVAPGDGKLIMPLFATAALRWFADYTNIDANATLNIRYTDSSFFAVSSLLELNSDVSNLLALGEDSFAYLPGRGQVRGTTFCGGALALSPMINKGLTLSIGNAASFDLTGGDAENSLKFTVYYTIVDL